MLFSIYLIAIIKQKLSKPNYKKKIEGFNNPHFENFMRIYCPSRSGASHKERILSRFYFYPKVICID
jgi:hypothetical protein